MSQQLPSMVRTGVAGEDMSTKKYYIVQMDASGNIEVGEGGTDLIVGVLQNKPLATEAAVYAFGGTSKVKIGTGGITLGQWVTSDTDGRGINTVTDGNVVVGRALATGVENDIVEVQLNVFTLFVA